MSSDLTVEEIFVSLFCRERFESSDHISYFLQNFAPVSVQRAVKDEHAQALLKSAALSLHQEQAYQDQAEVHNDHKDLSVLGLTRLYNPEAFHAVEELVAPSSVYCGITPWAHHELPQGAPDPDHPTTTNFSADQASSSFPSTTKNSAASSAVSPNASQKQLTVYGTWVSALDQPPAITPNSVAASLTEGGAQQPIPVKTVGVVSNSHTITAASLAAVKMAQSNRSGSIRMLDEAEKPAQCADRTCESCPMKDEPCCLGRQSFVQSEELVAAAVAAQHAALQRGREGRAHAMHNQLATLTIGSMYDFNDLCLAVRYALEEDHVRLIMSAAFRNLQQRTQVFPSNIHVSARSRMTHSLEVAAYSKLSLTALAERLPKLRIIIKEISACADTAALLHDIGHPPFGHFGEHVIRTWVKKICQREESLSNGEAPRLNAAQMLDLESFNSFAQSLHLMHSVYRFNMTFGQISAASRFPFTYAQLRMRGFDHESAVRTCGVYLSEEELLHRIQRTNLGTKRHPLALIIEQCDELAYTLGDIEDAYDLHVIDAKDVFELIEQLLEHLQNNACYTTCDECTSACTCAQGAERAAEAVNNPQHQGMHPERYADSATNTGSFTGLTSFTPFNAQGQPNRLSAAAQGVRELRSQRDYDHDFEAAEHDPNRPGWVQHNQRLREEERLHRAAREAAVKAAIDRARDAHASSSDIEAAARKAALDFERMYQKQQASAKYEGMSDLGGVNAMAPAENGGINSVSSEAIGITSTSRLEGTGITPADMSASTSGVGSLMSDSFARTSGVSSTVFGYTGTALAAGFAAPSSGYVSSELHTEALSGIRGSSVATSADLAAADSTTTVASMFSSANLTTQSHKTSFARQEKKKSLTAGAAEEAAKSFNSQTQVKLHEVIRDAIYHAYCLYKHDDFGVLSMVHDNTPTKLYTMMENLGVETLFKLLRDCLTSYFILDIVEAIAQDEEAFFGEGVLFIASYGNDAHKAIQFLKKYAQEQVYTNRQVESLELQGAAVLRGLLEIYEICLELSAEEFQACLKPSNHRSERNRPYSFDPLCARLLRRIPDCCIQAYLKLCEEHPLAEMYARMRLLIDHVSGMTDSYATHEFELLSGTQPPNHFF